MPYQNISNVLVAETTDVLRTSRVKRLLFVITEEREVEATPAVVQVEEAKETPLFLTVIPIVPLPALQ